MFFSPFLWWGSFPHRVTLPVQFTKQSLWSTDTGFKALPSLRCVKLRTGMYAWREELILTYRGGGILRLRLSNGSISFIFEKWLQWDKVKKKSENSRNRKLVYEVLPEDSTPKGTELSKGLRMLGWNLCFQLHSNPGGSCVWVDFRTKGQGHGVSFYIVFSMLHQELYSWAAAVHSHFSTVSALVW